MAITSELIGSLHTPGFGFLSPSRSTYALPKYSNGISILAVPWDSSKGISWDIIDRETGSTVFSTRNPSYATWENYSSQEAVNTFKKGALLRINDSKKIQVYIIPNPRQTPPVWNGK